MRQENARSLIIQHGVIKEANLKPLKSEREPMRDPISTIQDRPFGALSNVLGQ
jgi:hypothetical protein